MSENYISRHARRLRQDPSSLPRTIRSATLPLLHRWTLAEGVEVVQPGQKEPTRPLLTSSDPKLGEVVQNLVSSLLRRGRAGGGDEGSGEE